MATHCAQRPLSQEAERILTEGGILSASTCRPCLLVSASLQASKHKIGKCLFVIFVFFSSVYIGVRWGSEVRGHLHLGSGEPSPTSGGENHPTIQLLCTTTTTSSTTTTRGRACPTLPTRGGEPPIKGTSPHHPAPPAFLRIEYLGRRKRRPLQSQNKLAELGDAIAISNLKLSITD